MSANRERKIILLRPRSFCAGVVRAIDVVKIVINLYGAPIYVRKEIVHNRFVVEELQGKGAIFVDSVQEVPEGERVIYSAHGVSPEVREASEARNLRVIVDYPTGASLPTPGSTLSRDDARPYEITEVRRQSDGQLNVFVREIIKP